MRFLSTFLLLLLSLLFTSCSSLKSKANKHYKKDDPITVLSYNIHHANPPAEQEGVIDIDAICKVIREANPDLVALQEVDSSATRSGNRDQAKEIAAALGMHYYFAKAIDFQGGGYGLAILSRYPFESTQTIRLPEDAHPQSEDRVVALATIALPSGQTIRFASTHLDVENEANRLLQVERINELAKEQDLPFIIAGDFNSKTEDAPILLLKKDFDLGCTDCGFTIPTDKPKRTIDFITFYKKYPFGVLDHHVINDIHASDHLPVYARFYLTKHL